MVGDSDMGPSLSNPFSDDPRVLEKQISSDVSYREDHYQPYYREASDGYRLDVETEMCMRRLWKTCGYEEWNLKEGKLVTFARVLGFAKSTPGVSEFLRTRAAFNIYKMYSAFTSSGPTKTLEVKQMYDLDWECRQPFARQNYFQSLKVFTKCSNADGTGKSRQLYVFDRQKELTLGVASPVLALAIARLSEELPSFDSIVLRLLSLGVPFQVYGFRFTPLPRPEPVPVCIPTRPAGHIFTREDYEMYRRNVDNLFASPRMRAALLRGGYIWRIASGCVADPEILRGPSTSANFDLRHSAMQGAFTGDELTPQELAVIVGTYRCEINKGQVEYRSWWPPVHVYEDEKYGENLFRWTAWRENGYQERLKKIYDSNVENSTGPLTVKDWRRKMKGRGEWIKWRQALTRDASNYIEEHLSPASFWCTYNTFRFPEPDGESSIPSDITRAGLDVNLDDHIIALFTAVMSGSSQALFQSLIILAELPVAFRGKLSFLYNTTGQLIRLSLHQVRILCTPESPGLTARLRILHRHSRKAEPSAALAIAVAASSSKNRRSDLRPCAGHTQFPRCPVPVQSLTPTCITLHYPPRVSTTPFLSGRYHLRSSPSRVLPPNHPSTQCSQVALLTLDDQATTIEEEPLTHLPLREISWQHTALLPTYRSPPPYTPTGEGSWNSIFLLIRRDIHLRWKTFRAMVAAHLGAGPAVDQRIPIVDDDSEGRWRPGRVLGHRSAAFTSRYLIFREFSLEVQFRHIRIQRSPNLAPPSNAKHWLAVNLLIRMILHHPFPSPAFTEFERM
ncbi:hypothetical protein NMY22_g14106 [Coprinellus aureogranulatus]|nr:hypothetical protein NMY22_g14106 [Coprinellus aureogranulatus]